jgi:hypothetical protein
MTQLKNMKKTIFLMLILLFAIINVSMAQTKTQKYFTSGTELIFSWASIDNNGTEGNSVMRFTGFLHLQGNFNFDFNRSFGLYTGLALRNVGFIENGPDDGLKKKYRTYNVGIPIGFKLGSMGKTHLYAGYEIEFPINYKEKTFNNERKDDKFNVWFSNRTPAFYNSILVGVQFKYGMNLKFKYYLTNFFNQDYSEVNQDGITEYPYANKDVRIFYISLNINLFRDAHFNYTKEEMMHKF